MQLVIVLYTCWIGSTFAINNMVHVSNQGIILFCVLTTFGPDFTTAYGNGAPRKICDTMIPGHGKAQRNLAPYTIKVSESSFSPGGSLTGNLLQGFHRSLLFLLFPTFLSLPTFPYFFDKIPNFPYFFGSW